MPDTANTELADELLRHSVYLERYKAGELKKLQKFLTQLMNDVSGQLGQRLQDAAASGSARNARLQALLQELGVVSDAVANELVNVTRRQLQDLASYESGFLLTATRAILPVQVSLTAVAPVQLWAAVTAKPFQGRVLEQWFTDYTATQKAKIQQAVRMSVVEGETVDQAIRRIRGTKRLNYQDGIVMGQTRRSAEALARTAINHVVTTAREKTLQDNSDVVTGLQWRSTLDGATSEICRARDGKVYPLDSGPRPPAHPNCRSSIAPVLKSWQALGLNFKELEPGTRASMNGQVPEAETYQTWLKRQPVAFQNEVLGDAKAQLFRKGGLTLDKFVDEQAGRGYSLAQLRKLHPDAFSRAGL